MVLPGGPACSWPGIGGRRRRNKATGYIELTSELFIVLSCDLNSSRPSDTENTHLTGREGGREAVLNVKKK